MPLLPGQVGVDIDDRQDIQDALKLLPLVDSTFRDQSGQIEGQVQAKSPVDDHTQECGNEVGPEHPVPNHSSVTVIVQPLGPQKLLAV